MLRKLLETLYVILWWGAIVAIVVLATYIDSWKIHVCEQSTGLNWFQCQIYIGGHH